MWLSIIACWTCLGGVRRSSAEEERVRRPGARATWHAELTHLPFSVSEIQSDVEYAVAARPKPGLKPFPARALTALPKHCPLCRTRHTSEPVSLHDDPWHHLHCYGLNKSELSRRHDAIVYAIGCVAWTARAQVGREVEGLDPKSVRRPDLQLAFPGRMLLTDVVVSHLLTANAIARGQSRALERQRAENNKYAGVASRIGAELLNVSLDTCGGMAKDAVRLVEAVGEEGERWSMGTWKSSEIRRQVLSAIAVAAQRGNSLAMLAGYTRSTVRADTSVRRRSRMSGKANTDQGRETEGASDSE